MFLLADGDLVVSASDLRLAATCEFATVSALDVTLGRAPRPDDTRDAMTARIAELGNQHEQRELLRLSRAHPGRVVQFARPAYTREGLQLANAETFAALQSGAEVVVQATFFDGGFVGHADFLELTDQGWLVCDTKLARTESVPALLQIAAYAAQLASAGVPTAPVARLLLGSGLATDHAVADLLPVYAARRTRLDQVLAEHRADAGPATWGDPRWLACGRCDVCVAAAEVARDVLLVAGVRMPTRHRLIDAGVATIDDLATRTEPVPGMRYAVLDRLRHQAALQSRQDHDPDGTVFAEVTAADALAKLPPPSPGDLFFDFEGDPLWAERGSLDWGLEYLFGIVEIDTGQPVYRAFWATDREEEKQALIDFLRYLSDRRRQWPDLHVYHYADYEKAALLRLAVRHAVGEEEVDQLLREGVLVDLFTVVRGGIRISQRSYSIKKLEPLYMPVREIDLQSGGDSIVVHHELIAAREMGHRERAETLEQEIRDYNRDDCVSTWLLRDWLLARLAETGSIAGATPATRIDPTAAPTGPREGSTPTLTPQRQARIDLEIALRALIDGVKAHERNPEQQAVALAAAAVQFHAREDKPFWWRHFDRLRSPMDDWVPDSGVFLVLQASEESPWQAATARQRPRRRLRLLVEPHGGIAIRPGAEVSAVYAAPPPPGIEVEPAFHHAKSPATVTVLETGEALDIDGQLRQEILIEELMPKDGERHPEAPVALVPGGVIPAASIDVALSELAQDVRASWPDLPRRPAIDLLLRRTPRLTPSGPDTEPGLPPVVDGDFVSAIAQAVHGLDRSSLAVQGPPGTGKTYVAARVITQLVREHGWRIGVCSQSHAAIENLLEAVIDAGLPGGQVAKMTKETPDPPWTPLDKADELADFASGQSDGYVIGGTAWDLTNTRRVARDQLDLVVIDEAGQFSLAKTMAVSVAAPRLLLLGDPQQLPQVTQGQHPDPVDLSALGWLIGDEPVLSPDLGYFLDTTWRMHPALTTPVSRLAYAGQLNSRKQVTTARSLAGVAPGLHLRLVEHDGNSTSSPEEATAVVDLVRDLLGRTWTDPRDESAAQGRPLEQGDILVVAAYNNQVATIASALADADLEEVAVGTVDKFQGREAPVAILSMAASAPSDVSRGIGFLLNRNRLNVAISRGKHAAYLVHSPLLVDLAPRSPAELTTLGAFLGLRDQAVDQVTVSSAPGTDADHLVEMT